MKTKRNKKGEFERDLLYRSFDEDLSTKKKIQLENSLKKSEALRMEKNQIQHMRGTLAGFKELSFSPFFVKRVVSRLKTSRPKNGLESLYLSMKSIFRPIAVAGTVLLLALLLYNIRLGDSLNSDEVLYASNATIQEILDIPLF